MIFDEIKEANIQALRDHNKIKRSVLTMVLGKFKNASINNMSHGTTLPDPECLNIISKTIKELEEERLSNVKAKRDDKVLELEQQKEILAKFLPKMLSEDEIKEEINKLTDKSIPSVMKHFKTNFNGLCDMALVSKIAKEFK